ncbi:MAG: hypothetical protein NC548_31490 [Lachnospiraceae bacterium]|nr:hypothetical protein [Lachnospiraceae bacterium]
MIDVKLLQRKNKLPEADYILDKSEKLLSLFEVLTPKLKGQWEILLIDPRIVEAKKLLDSDIVPDFVNCHLLLSQAKLDVILMDYPKLAPKEVSVKDAYKEMISGLKHMIDKNAMWLLYNTIGPNVSLLQESLDKLDAECDGVSITTKQIQSTFAVTKRVYAADVLLAFLHKDRYRWFKLNTLVKELGEEYTYYALYKQARIALHDKNKYLHNEDIKNKIATTVDAPFICYCYILFVNSNNWRNLYGILYDLDNRGSESIERSMYVNLQ